MKKLTRNLVTILFILLTLSSFTQVVNAKWEKCFGGTEWDEGKGMIFSDDTYWIVGSTESDDGDISFNHGAWDIWLINIDEYGNFISEKTFGGSYFDGGFVDIKKLNDSVFYIVGRTKSNDGDISFNPWPGPEGNYWVLQINNQGEILWEKVLGGSGMELMRDATVTNDGGIIALGLSNSTDGDISNPNGGFDLWMVKLNSVGEKQWDMSLGGIGSEEGASVKQTSDGGYIVVGDTDGRGGGNFDSTCNHHEVGFYDVWVVKLDSLRNIRWQQCYGGTYSEGGLNIIETGSGYVVLGTTMSNDGDVSGLNGPPGPNSEYGGDIWVFKIDFEGNLLWQKCLGGTYDDFARNIFTTSDGGFMVVGATGSDDGDVEGYHGIDVGIYEDVWLAKLDSLGNLSWQYCYGGGGREMIQRGVVQKGDFNYVITLGTDTDQWQCGGQMWPDLRIVELYDSTVGIDETLGNAIVLKVFPNPASNILHLQTKTGEGKEFRVFDIFGKQIIKTSMPENGEQQIDVSPWPSGLYLLSLFDKGQLVLSRKVLIN
ncbi:MAG: T9SS type A sorting domain-containing protein [Bacteroidales bacterium]|nr:T9SS type A sorting domain-containing protein [Bacteroidales bacterium]